MMETFPIVATLATAYLLGSIPAGYIAGRLAGIDIRSAGSGNIGATNVTRILGKRYGFPVFAIDFMKGLAAVLFAILVSRHAHLDESAAQLLKIISGFMCVVGHSFPVWLCFRGGKGVATSAGVLFGLAPVAAVIGLMIWCAVFCVTRYVSLASIGTAVALPLVILALAKTGPLFYVAAGLAVFVIFRHRSNIERLARGTEPRYKRK